MSIVAENNWVPSIVLGVVLVCLGLIWMRSHLVAWRNQRADEDADDFDLAHHAGRFQRRMQTSGMVILIGILVPVGDVFVWSWGPVVASVFWLGVLFLALWVGVQALGDFTSVQSYSRAAMSRVNTQRQQAEAELSEYRRRKANGE